MKKAIQEHVARLLDSKEIQGFLALKEQSPGVVAPHLFTRAQELEALNLGEAQAAGDARYPLVKLLARLAEAKPEMKLGVLVRGCDERALIRLEQDDRVHPLSGRKVVAVGLACPRELADAHQCAQPWPENLVAGEPAQPAPPAPLEEGELVAELEGWFDTLDRCLKCFGCRDVCPVCSCYECTIENQAHVPQRDLPASRSFLMTRAMHMVDRCVYCGLCEEACPAGIPLKGLYRLVARMAGREGLLPMASPPEGHKAQAGA